MVELSKKRTPRADLVGRRSFCDDESGVLVAAMTSATASEVGHRGAGVLADFWFQGNRQGRGKFLGRRGLFQSLD